MVPNNNNKCKMPLLAAECENEENSDVTFLVGPDREYRVPGHRSVLSFASPVFRAMFEGPLAEGPVVTIQDVEPRAFDNLLRFIYSEKVQLQSVETALSTLYAAHKYHCENLERSCLNYLSSRLDTSCVLPILHNLHFYCSIIPTSQRDNSPSAPTLDVIESRTISESNLYASCCSHKVNQDIKKDINTCYRVLHEECLQYIDLHADNILQQEFFDELNKDELLSIVQRDTFGVSSELLLFNALVNWSTFQCKCNHWELCPEKRGHALGKDLLYSVRYLLMNSEEFMNGPMRSKLLSADECNVLLAFILNHSLIPNPPDNLKELFPILSRKREKPLTHHSSSSLQNSHEMGASKSDFTSTTTSPTKPRYKKHLNKKRELSLNGLQLEERKPNMSDYFFSCIACVFD